MKDWMYLVEKAKQGDLDAFNALVVKFRDLAVGYAYSLLRDFHLAEDAAQEAFIQAYRDIGTLKEARAFPAWFRKIIFKFCNRITRKKQHPLVSIELAMEQSSPLPLPGDKLESREAEEQILHCVQALPDPERVVTTLFYINGYSMAEVGSFLEVPVSTVKNRLYAARKKIKERMVTMVKETLHKHAQDERFNTRIRQVLEKVPVVSFELQRKKEKGGVRRCPETVPFASCLRAYLEYTGQGFTPSLIDVHGGKWRLDNSYLLALGTSGAAFKLNWRPGFYMDNPLLSHIVPDPWEPEQRALDNLGIACEILKKEENNRELLKKRIVEHIRQKQHPLVARGVVGPPEECLITGFDEEGEVLIGWSFFQKTREFREDVEYEANGYFRKRNWFKDLQGIFLLGDREKEFDPAAVYRKALTWAVQVMENPQVCAGVPNGIAAYQAWIDTIADDAAFTGKKVKELVFRYIVHHSNVGLLAECRWYGHLFFRRIQEETGADPLLMQAANAFNAIHDTMWKVWGAAGGIGVTPGKAKRFADPAVRRQVIGLLEQSRELDREGLGSIKEWLRKQGVFS